MAVAVLLGSSMILVAHASDRILRQQSVLGEYPWLVVVISVVITLALVQLQEARAAKRIDSARDALFWPAFFSLSVFLSAYVARPADGWLVNARGALLRLAGLAGASLLIYTARKSSLQK
jgi:hypothetical protein